MPLAKRLLMVKRAPAFDPRTITGLVSWHDFSDISSLFQDTAATSPINADGQEILRANDKSGNGYHVTEATNGPEYDTARLNGLSVAKFLAASSTTLGNTSYFDILSTDKVTTFFVAQLHANANTGFYDIDTGGGTNTGQSVLATGSAMMSRVGAAEDRINDDLTDLATTWTSHHIIATRWNTTTLEHFQNGVPEGTDPIPTALTGPSTHLHIGSLHGLFYSNAYIGELIVYSTALSNTDMNQVGNYLATKWGKTWTAVT
jgi:hypothetical protein